MYPRHAAFIEGAEDFAASFFNISAPEACCQCACHVHFQLSRVQDAKLLKPFDESILEFERVWPHAGKI